jgi:hypothetical protein
VRARDAAGNLDASRARRDFSVTAPDVAAPTFSLGGKRTQRVGRSIRLVVKAVGEDLSASLTASVSVPGASRPYKLTGVNDRFIARGEKATLRAKLPRRPGPRSDGRCANTRRSRRRFA